MRDYIFKILIDGQLFGEGYGQGNSAMEAFESGIETGSVYFSGGQEVEILALSNRGLGIRFSAVKGL